MRLTSASEFLLTTRRELVFTRLSGSFIKIQPLLPIKLTSPYKLRLDVQRSPAADARILGWDQRLAGRHDNSAEDPRRRPGPRQGVRGSSDPDPEEPLWRSPVKVPLSLWRSPWLGLSGAFWKVSTIKYQFDQDAKHVILVRPVWQKFVEVEMKDWLDMALNWTSNGGLTNSSHVTLSTSCHVLKALTTNIIFSSSLIFAPRSLWKNKSWHGGWSQENITFFKLEWE